VEKEMGEARMGPHHFSSCNGQFAVDIVDAQRAVGLRYAAGDIAHDGVEGVGGVMGMGGGFLEFALQAGECTV
jgi:hypothetical protein